jgi:hypothetical protein
MAGTRSPLSGDSERRRATLKQRAADARAHGTATKAWDAHIRAATAGSLWRVTAAWVEQACGTRCADLTHVGSGKTRTIRVGASEALEAWSDHLRVE